MKEQELRFRMATQGNATTGNAVASLVGVMNSAKEKWDQSGASEAMTRVTQSIPQGTREYISMTSSQLFDRKNVRSATVCFGIGEERPFYVEKSPSLLMARVQHNFTFFYLNYMILTAVLFCLTLLINPFAIIGMVLLGLAWMYVIRSTQQAGALIVYGISISQTNATIGMGIISVIVLLKLLSSVFWWTLFSSGFIVLVHAVLRDASMHQDGDDKVDMVGEFSGTPTTPGTPSAAGEDTAFLKGPTNAV